MFTHSVFWLWFAGITALACGLIAIRKELIAAKGLDKLIALGPVFVAAAMATFAAEHIVDASEIVQAVPPYMPARLFVVYFVASAWIAAAISLITMKFLRLSATLLGVAFFLLVLMIHLPNALANPANRIPWIFVLRESAFAGGAWALAGSQSGPHSRKQNWMILIGRFSMALAVIHFGISELLHPEFTPGVPDTKLTPTYIPLHALWGYPVGALLLTAGIALLINKRPRLAAASIGMVMTLLTLFLFLPILAFTHDPSQMTEAINFVFDTMLFGGAALLVARAMPAEG